MCQTLKATLVWLVLGCCCLSVLKVYANSFQVCAWAAAALSASSSSSSLALSSWLLSLSCLSLWWAAAAAQEHYLLPDVLLKLRLSDLKPQRPAFSLMMSSLLLSSPLLLLLLLSALLHTFGRSTARDECVSCLGWIPVRLLWDCHKWFLVRGFSKNRC